MAPSYPVAPVSPQLTMNAEFKPRAPSTFSGSPTEDVNDWLFRMRQYCRLLAVPEFHHALLASTYLEGNAGAWWRAHVEDAEANLVTAITTWDEFQTALSHQFTIVDASDTARDRLLTLRQTSSIEEYVREFRKTIVHIVPVMNRNMFMVFPICTNMDMVMHDMCVRGTPLYS
jgi:Retrotransposon gag protein